MMTGHDSRSAAVRTALPEACGRRQARNLLRAILARTVTALAAAAIFYTGPPALATPVFEEPTVSIAAQRSSFGFGIDDVVFTLRRDGPKRTTLYVRIAVVQSNSYLPQFKLFRTVAFPANATKAELRIPVQDFNGPATASGSLAASVIDAGGYGVGLPNYALTRMVVMDPAITVRPERASYRFVEGKAGAQVAFVARTVAGLPRPNKSFEVSVASSSRPGGASVPGDTAPVMQALTFEPGDFVPDGRQWVARKEVAVDIMSDREIEPEEIFDLVLRYHASTPSRVRISQADGSACTANQCPVPVTIADDPGPVVERIAISPVPPAASARHGPFYRRDAFLALPDGAVHGQGAALTFTLNLDAEVTVTGTPELVLDVFGRERRARYTGGSGTRQLTFAWTVQKGDNDPDGLEFRSLDLNGGTIRGNRDRIFKPKALPAQRFAEHRVRGGLHTMRLEVSGSAREGEPLELRVIRDGGYDEAALAVVGVTDSAMPNIPGLSAPMLNGPGNRQFSFRAGAANEPGVSVVTHSVTPLGDGAADAERTLTVQLAPTDSGIFLPTGQRARAWYLAGEPVEVTVPVVDTGQPLVQPGLRVSEASSMEAPGARLAFRVMLSPRSESPVTVDYRTEDFTSDENRAVAGSDYVASSGTLTFQPGETMKTVGVEVLADDHDEESESMRLVLSNAQGARLDKSSGVGFIRNSGPMPKAWIARFGRTVADQVLSAVESRMRAQRRPGVEITLGGHRADPRSGMNGQSSGGSPGAAAGLPEWLKGGRDPVWREHTASNSPASHQPTMREMLAGTAFAVTQETGRRETVSLWGRGAVTRFDGRQGSVSLDGEVASGMVGADWSRDPGSGAGGWTAGMIVAHSVGEGGYADNSRGRVEATLTGLFPWGRFALTDRIGVWGAAGYAVGSLKVTPGKPGTEEDAAAIRTDLNLWTAAAGLRGVLVDGGPEGLTLTGKTDALIVQTASDAARGADGGYMAAARATVTRLRLGLEAERPFGMGDVGTLTPSATIGMRHDDGDAERGFGVDMGAGLAWTAPKYGLRVELHGRGLLTHEAKGFRERGFSGSLAWDPKPSTSRGPTLALTQTLGGPASGGADALLERGALTGLAAQPGPGGRSGPLHRRVEVRFGYGFTAWSGRFVSVPEIGLGLSDSGREYILGWRLAGEGPAGPGAFQLSAEARRIEAAGGGAAEHRIGAKLSAHW